MKKINKLHETKGAGLELVMFTLPLCGPCKMMKSGLNNLDKHRLDVLLYEIDADESPAEAHGLGIQSTPTLIILKEGEEVGRTVGFRPLPQILSTLESL